MKAAKAALLAMCAATLPCAASIANRALLVHTDEFTEKWIERAKGLGLTTLSVHPEGGGGAVASLTNLLAACRDPGFRRRVDMAIDAGLRVEYEMHAGSWLVPRSLFPARPWLFRMDTNGVRTAHCNFCVSSPEALEIAARRACELAKALYRPSHRHYFWLDDGKGEFCSCAACSRLSPSDQQLVALNAMVRALRTDDPEAKLAYLAYFDTLPAPAKVRPEPGIFLEYAPIGRAHDRPLEGQEAARAEDVSRLLDFFGRSDARVLEYWYDNSLRSGWKKPERRFVPNPGVVRADLDWYGRLGFAEAASFACFLGPGYERRWGEPDLGSFRQER